MTHPNMNTPNETIQTIYQRRSIRQFQKKAIDDSLIEMVLNAANQAPSAHNQQSWQFIIIQDKKKQDLCKFVSMKASQFPKPSASILRMAARSIASAPVVIAVMNTGDLIYHGTELFKIDTDLSGDFFCPLRDESHRDSGEPTEEHFVLDRMGTGRCCDDGTMGKGTSSISASHPLPIPPSHSPPLPQSHHPASLRSHYSSREAPVSFYR